MQINITYGIGSTGDIALSLANKAASNGYESVFLYSVHQKVQDSCRSFSIENYFQYLSRRFLNKYFGKKLSHSNAGTRRLIRIIKKEKPDLIHIHNVQQNSVNFCKLFSFLKTSDFRVVFTLHDCWSFTGGCFHFDKYECLDYPNSCINCKYDMSFDDCVQKSYFLYKAKEDTIGKNDNIYPVCVSNWLRSSACKSYMGRMNHPPITIYNGIDLCIFHPRKNGKIRSEYNLLKSTCIIIGVASIWTKDKGIEYFDYLSSHLDETYKIVLVGKIDDNLKKTDKIIYINKEIDKNELAEYYSDADIFVNPSSCETFGLTTAESLACGTPAIVLDSTANPEIIDLGTGVCVKKGYENVLEGVYEISKKGKLFYSENCVNRARKLFDKENMLNSYLSLYKEVLMDGKNNK